MVSDKERARKLIKEAYEFGYFVGYKGHSEWAEWVRGMRNRLYSEAEMLGVYELVRDAYARGKEDGTKKREEEINLSLIEKGKLPEESPKPKRRIEKPEGALEGEESEQAEFAEFLETTKLTLPPEILDSMRHLEFPKMLRQGR